MKRQYDLRFEKLLKFVFEDEGGFSDDPDDRGGRTNYGITQASYNFYRDKRGISRADVKNITKDEAKDIYYEDYYKTSGADKQNDIRDAYILFDTAVNFHPIIARKLFRKSNGDFYKMLECRKLEHQKEAKKYSKQAKYLRGWLDRVDRIEERAEQLYMEEKISSSYKEQVTPFNNVIQKAGNKLDENDRIKNKIEYYMQKNKETLDTYDKNYKANIKDVTFADEDIAKMSTSEFRAVEHIINNQLENKRFLSKKEAESQVQSGNLIWVDEYIKSDGTKVKGHYRTKAS